MRKKVLLPLLLLVLLAGIAFARYGRSSQVTPHTINYVQSEYGDEGQLATANTIRRSVNMAGVWTHTRIINGQEEPMGSGQLVAFQPHPPPAGLEHKQFLGYEVVVVPFKAIRNGQTTTVGEGWYSPVLDDFLKITRVNENGVTTVNIEATDVQLN